MIQRTSKRPRCGTTQIQEQTAWEILFTMTASVLRPLLSRNDSQYWLRIVARFEEGRPTGAVAFGGESLSLAYNKRMIRSAVLVNLGKERGYLLHGEVY